MKNKDTSSPRPTLPVINRAIRNAPRCTCCKAPQDQAHKPYCLVARYV